jgi:hypothetical protein
MCIKVDTNSIHGDVLDGHLLPRAHTLLHRWPVLRGCLLLLLLCDFLEKGISSLHATGRGPRLRGSSEGGIAPEPAKAMRTRGNISPYRVSSCVLILFRMEAITTMLRPTYHAASSCWAPAWGGDGEGEKREEGALLFLSSRFCVFCPPCSPIPERISQRIYDWSIALCSYEHPS